MCASIPFGVWHRLCAVDLVIPYWHVVSDEHLPHVNGLSRFRNVRQFQCDLEFFLRYYSPVTERDVISRLHDDGRLPERSVLLTFDDGFREVYDIIAPLLRSKGVPASFFLMTAAIDNKELCYTQKKSLLIDALTHEQKPLILNEVARTLSLGRECDATSIAGHIRRIPHRGRHVLDEVAAIMGCDLQEYLTSRRPYLTSEEVESLVRQGFTIGAHSVDHPSYAELTLQEQLDQTHRSMRWLADRFNIRCHSFAFPYRSNGVSLEFFQAMFRADGLRVSFGTGGLLRHPFPYNLSRSTPELSDAPASEALARDFCRKLITEWRAGGCC
jgi:peptidoglycan/xylan/chitin deacetylase (PgdA/CDA1 family)